MTLIKVLDFETNGLTDEADPLEFGYQDIVQGGDGSWRLGDRDGFFLQSDQPLDPEAQAVHHITERQVREGADLEYAWRKAHNWGADFDHVYAYAAHNIGTELRYLAGMTKAPWVCTMKCAMRAWPDCPSFSNQVIRYWRKIPVAPADLALANSSHQATADAFVTALTLLELLKEHGPAQLIAWTLQPKIYPRLTFGKHKGLRWRDVPRDYLDWMIFKARDDGSVQDWPDFVHCAKMAMRGEL